MGKRLSGFLQVALVLIASAFGPRARAADGAVRIDRATHGVSTRYYSNTGFDKAEGRRNARPGQQLRCDGRCDLSMRHGVTIVMRRGAILRPASALFIRLPGEERARRCDAVELLGGEIVLERKEGNASPLVIQVAGRQLALWHGRVRMKARRGGVGLMVESGRSSLKAGAWRALRPRRAYGVDDDVVERPAVVRPRWWPGAVGDRPMSLIALGTAGDVSLAWSPVAGAARYVLEVSASADFETLVAERTVDAPATHAPLRLDHGRHFARIFALDPDGFRSPASATRQAGVVRIGLPSGAALARRGRIKLPHQESLTLFDHEALEMRRLGHRFAPAPAGLIARDHNAVVLLRFKGDRHTRTSFWLQKQALDVRFSMTPKQPMWPWHDITIEARVHAEGAPPDLDELGLRFSTFLDGRPISARYKRHGAVFVARVARRFVRKPVLLSTEARDGSGNVLGRGFVEVLGATRRAVAADPRVRHLLR